MKVIIFEGIATSGKTTLEKLLKEGFRNVEIISETKTLMELIDNRDPEVALDHLQKILNEFKKKKVDILIIDRFHLTHAFRTANDLNFFNGIDEQLTAYDTLLVLLTVAEDKIQERIEETARIRDGGWSKGKRGTIEEKVKYYTNQQLRLKYLFDESRLNKMMIDTTEKGWRGYVWEIVREVKCDLVKYRREIENFPELTQEETLIFVNELPDEVAQMKLINHHLQLAYRIAEEEYKKLPLKNKGLGEHIKMASEALMECVRHPDRVMTVDKKLFREDFKGFVTRWIKARFTQQRSVRRIPVAEPKKSDI